MSIVFSDTDYKILLLFSCQCFCQMIAVAERRNNSKLKCSSEDQLWTHIVLFQWFFIACLPVWHNLTTFYLRSVPCHVNWQDKRKHKSGHGYKIVIQTCILGLTRYLSNASVIPSSIADCVCPPRHYLVPKIWGTQLLCTWGILGSSMKARVDSSGGRSVFQISYHPRTTFIKCLMSDKGKVPSAFLHRGIYVSFPSTT